MWLCKLCGAEYEPPKNRRLVCAACSEKALTLPSQMLSLEQRLWGKCYESDGHWEYGAVESNGRIGRIMLERRQQPAPHVALVLAGRPRPDVRHYARAVCANKLCVNPEHLDWMRAERHGTPGWAFGLDPDIAVDVLTYERQQRAKYQRAYRQRLRMAGVQTVTELVERSAAARQAAYEASRSAPAPLAPSAAPEPAAVVIEPPAASAAPAASPVDLLASVRGARIAPVD